MLRGLLLILMVLLPLDGFALCTGDFDADGDVDVWNLNELASGRKGLTASFFAADFGRANCPPLPAAPLNQFNIGDSIGEGEAVYNDPFILHHEAVWSTGYDFGDIVYSLNERFKDIDPIGYFENESFEDGIFNQAASGAAMAEFEAQASAVVAASSATPSETAGMISVLLGSNDVCSASSIQTLQSDASKNLFEQEYRAGLDALAASLATRNAYISVSSIPDIYWLWNAKRSSFWCRVIVWPSVPCEILLDSPLNDCGAGNSHLDPDTIHPDDGPDCIRRKEFHAAIRERYNSVLSDVLLEYKTDGRLPNAYFVDIFDIQFDDTHVNSGDCFHPSIEGHEMLAREEWCRSPWSATDLNCGN